MEPKAEHGQVVADLGAVAENVQRFVDLAKDVLRRVGPAAPPRGRSTAETPSPSAARERRERIVVVRPPEDKKTLSGSSEMKPAASISRAYVPAGTSPMK